MGRFDVFDSHGAISPLPFFFCVFCPILFSLYLVYLRPSIPHSSSRTRKFISTSRYLMKSLEVITAESDVGHTYPQAFSISKSEVVNSLFVRHLQPLLRCSVQLEFLIGL